MGDRKGDEIMKSIKGKVIRDIRNQEAKRKQLQKEVFRQVYNRPTEKAFSDIDQLNMDSYNAPMK